MANILNEDLRALPDYQPAYMWRILVTKEAAAAPAPADLNLLCKSSTVPKREDMQMFEITVHTQKRILPGVQHTAGRITLTVTEVVTNEVKLWIEALNTMSRGRNAEAETFADTAMEITLFQMGRDGEDSYKYDLKEVFLETFDPGTEFQDGESTTYFTDMQLGLSYSDFIEGAA